MKKSLLAFLIISIFLTTTLQAQSTIVGKNGSGWLISTGVHYFPKQNIVLDYEPIQGLTIFSQVTKAPAFEVTRFFRQKGRLSSSIGLRFARIPTDAGMDVAEGITLNGYDLNEYYKISLPYATIKGLINCTLFEKNKFALVQSIGTSFVLIPRGFANYQVKSFSSGSLVYYYVSKGAYNPSGIPFFALLGQTSLSYAVSSRRKLFLNVSYEASPRDAVISDYTFFTKTNELRGKITRRYQHVGVQLGFFWALKSKKYINRDPYEEALQNEEKE